MGNILPWYKSRPVILQHILLSTCLMYFAQTIPGSHQAFPPNLIHSPRQNHHKMYIQDLSIGLLGGGQLGRMLLQEAINLDLQVFVLDPSADAPCKNFCSGFTKGDFRDYQTVLDFGKDKDILTIEFEDVNVDALETLEKAGKKVFPQPAVLRMIKDKALQKQFYRDHGIPTPPFHLFEDKKAMLSGNIRFPAFQKVRVGGYDGYGVKKIADADALKDAFDAPSIVEEAVEIEKELSIIISRNEKGEIAVFPVVELVFNPVANMVQFLFAPAEILPEQATTATELARKIATESGIIGLLAVEMFLDRQGNILVNEMAPRPHNSGHHSIEANYISQYEAHLRAILGLSPGSTETISAAAMINILGEKEAYGKPVYNGLETLMHEPGLYIHLYGKSQVKPFRKMGHITLLGHSVREVKEKALRLKDGISVTGT